MTAACLLVYSVLNSVLHFLSCCADHESNAEKRRHVQLVEDEAATTFMLVVLLPALLQALA